MLLVSSLRYSFLFLLAAICFQCYARYLVSSNSDLGPACHLYPSMAISLSAEKFSSLASSGFNASFWLERADSSLCDFVSVRRKRL
ncbi:hypothetical protein C8J56DRAFT_932137, partial [Mycena floridula]